ncbi:hypothetical protein HDV06_001650 [Boothiomyces sp. JEL0866]|nr:hypothetical protein HDV06_001650 [Boothiomyces sp. JEL0866]
MDLLLAQLLTQFEDRLEDIESKIDRKLNLLNEIEKKIDKKFDQLDDRLDSFEKKRNADSRTQLNFLKHISEFNFDDIENNPQRPNRLDRTNVTPRISGIAENLSRILKSNMNSNSAVKKPLSLPLRDTPKSEKLREFSHHKQDNIDIENKRGKRLSQLHRSAVNALKSKEQSHHENISEIKKATEEQVVQAIEKHFASIKDTTSPASKILTPPMNIADLATVSNQPKGPADINLDAGSESGYSCSCQGQCECPNTDDENSHSDDYQSGNESFEMKKNQENVTIPAKFTSVSDMWFWWHAEKQFANKCPPGGIEFLEDTEGYQWRTHFNTKEKTLFLKVRFVITFVGYMAEKTGKSVDTVLQELDEKYKGHGCTTIDVKLKHDFDPEIIRCVCELVKSKFIKHKK